MTPSRPSLPIGIDPTAIDILFRKHWSPSGWTNGTITAAEFDYAKQLGLMFDPIDVTHEAVIARALDIRQKIAPERVGRAFLASLSTRRMDWRSALGSLSAVLHLPSHSFVSRSNSSYCAICGEVSSVAEVDLNVLNFERLKWGGVRHDRPHYAALDLEWFASLTVPEPTDKDLQSLSAAIETMSKLPANARPADLEKSLRGLFPSNAWERRTIIDILGLAGILIPRNRPTFWGEYPFWTEREGPPNKNDWRYPVLWWSGSDGINRDALRYWFPSLA
jgi:hypothetical protein